MATASKGISTLRLFAGAIGERVDLRCQLAPGLPSIWTDEASLE